MFFLRHLIVRAIFQRQPLYVVFVDFQKAYDTVKNDLLWACLQAFGFSSRLLAAISSLYSSGALSMRGCGTVVPALL